VVVGAANSAVDVAMETWRKGADVTMVVRDEQIRESVKYWIRPDVENRIKEGSIKAFFNAGVKQIRNNEVDIQTENGVVTIENDFVLAMTGYLPDFGFLDRLGIQLEDDEFKTPVHNPETMETNVKNVYLAGVICGGLKTNKWFIENSRIHAEQIVEDILSKSAL
jgi:thioredoxin reductase (NADPH)